MLCLTPGRFLWSSEPASRPQANTEQRGAYRRWVAGRRAPPTSADPGIRSWEREPGTRDQETELGNGRWELTAWYWEKGAGNGDCSQELRVGCPKRRVENGSWDGKISRELGVQKGRAQEPGMRNQGLGLWGQEPLLRDKS